MNRKFPKLFRDSSSAEMSSDAHLGEDMTPSPATLAEKSALTKNLAAKKTNHSKKPFFSSVDAPVRDFSV